MTDPAQPTATSIQTLQHLSPGTLLAGRFRVEAMLGIGGMGVVYRARQVSLDREVALKLLSFDPFSAEALISRFRTEARHAGRLKIT